jgi:uncharacterized protein YecE (DUF72 family)
MSQCEVLIGTSGFGYTEWKGLFYPETLKRNDYIDYYAHEFNCVELDFSYYNMPSPKTLGTMIERSDGRLKFAIKAVGKITHEIDPNNWRSVVTVYRQSIYPLIEMKCLTSVLLQFPYSFGYTESNRRYLAALIDAFEDTPLTVEFCHTDWQKPRVYAEFERRKISYCLCDMPILTNLPTCLRELNAFKTFDVTDSRLIHYISGDRAYVRFHGRNAEKWYSDDSRERYNYLYSDEELEYFVPLLKSIIANTKQVQIFFNNHAKSNSVVNARKMKLLLGV